MLIQNLQFRLPQGGIWVPTLSPCDLGQTVYFLGNAMLSGALMYKKCLSTLWCELYGMSQPRLRKQQWLNSEGWQWSSQLPSSMLGAGVTEAGKTDEEFARAQCLLMIGVGERRARTML